MTLEEMCNKLSMMCGACQHCDTAADHKPCDACPGKHHELAYVIHPAIKAHEELCKQLGDKE